VCGARTDAHAKGAGPIVRKMLQNQHFDHGRVDGIFYALKMRGRAIVCGRIDSGEIRCSAGLPLPRSFSSP
jgi:hypothetical protein